MTYGYSAVDNAELNLDGRSTDGYGDECPEFDECGNYLRDGSGFDIAMCDYHGRFVFKYSRNLGCHYEALDF